MSLIWLGTPREIIVRETVCPSCGWYRVDHEGGRCSCVSGDCCPHDRAIFRAGAAAGMEEAAKIAERRFGYSMTDTAIEKASPKTAQRIRARAKSLAEKVDDGE